MNSQNHRFKLADKPLREVKTGKLVNAEAKLVPEDAQKLVMFVRRSLEKRS